MMERSTTEKDDGWSFTTNWTIAAGSLSSTISVESSTDSTIIEDHPIKTPLPLLLTPPPHHSPLSHPCQIHINFTQKQEVQQVYVRSTARVYEIYSARSLESNNEYLCTVRCGIATRDDEILHASDVEAVANSKNINKEKEKENCISSEEDWVDVNVLDMPLKDERLNVVHEKVGANQRMNRQDLYEATAEFTDSDACTSLTLRLLSLQTKDSINIDEIYIFAEPSDSAYSEAQTAPLGNSTSLMSMLVPTLLQLSKSSNDQRQDIHAPKSSENGQYMDVGSKGNRSIDFENTHKQENIKAVTKSSDVHISEEESRTGQRYNPVAQTDVFTNRIESVLEQLVSRVSRIEDICLRFEETMLIPIKSIEQRLQLVEEQVQVLVKNSQPFKLPSDTRITAPDFSCGESNSSSFYTEGNENPSFGEMEFKKKDTSFSAKFHPGLVISAPEFLCHDDEENNDRDHMAKDCTTGLKNGCPQEKPRQALSIDDALAAALSGFIANTTVQPAHYTQALSVKAPEFTVEDNSDDDMEAKQNENPLVPPTVTNDLCGTECKDREVSSSFKFTMDENGDDGMATKQYENALVSPIYYNESNGSKCRNGSPEEINGQDKLVTNCLSSEPELEFAQPNDSQILDPASVGEPSDEFTNSVSVKNDILNAVSENTEFDLKKSISENSINLDENGESQKTDSRSVEEPSSKATLSVSGNNGTVDDTEVESVKSTSENSIDSPWGSCVVDFELPILDVQFTSSKFTSATSSLEGLFDNKSKFVAEAFLVEQKNGYEKIDLVPDNPLPFCKDLLDCDVNDLSYGRLGLEGEALDDSLARDKQDSFPSLL